MPKADGTQWERTLTMKEDEESVLVKMATYFLDMGWIDDDSEKAFDSLVEKICEPAPWDYAIDDPRWK
ncbi:hypothetical protein PHM2_070 [Prochlorococcus phage P-HM2]|uniref:Uncharacterized protein n=1 Tax=Prochlorococcus phage P-HM2 TaxID=445696 RepID=E3SSS0_9CAUD|nr:hypothetical protein PHM2_070 [Prochlorococcus phage P-HM2]ADO99848.1 hypothetical protein PHM2_070 [Prochlorococcus phage P-HM2]